LAQITSELNNLLPGVKKLTDIFSEISSSFDDVKKTVNASTVAVKDFTLQIQKAVAALQNFHGPSDITSAAPAEEGAAAEGLVALGGAAAAVAAALVGVVVAARSFVGALSPVTVAGFDRALKDLSATIGVALVPIIQILTNTIRQVAGIILPVMEALRPVIAAITNVFSSLLIPIIKNVVSQLLTFLPIIQLVVAVLEVLGSIVGTVITALGVLGSITSSFAPLLEAIFEPVIDILHAVQAVFEGVTDVIKVFVAIIQVVIDLFVAFVKSLLGSLSLKTVITQVQDAFKTLIVFLLRAAIQIGKLFGVDITKALIDKLTPKQGATAAIEGTGIKTFEQIAKDMESASFTATGAGPGDQKRDIIQEAIEELKKDTGENLGNIAEKINTLITKSEQVIEKISELIQKLPTKGEIIKTGQGAAQGAVKGSIFGPIGSIGGGIAGGLGYL